MTEKERVLLQREAVRHYIAKAYGSGLHSSVDEFIRALFPLPPEKVPNVVEGKDRKQWRQNPLTGAIEVRHPGNEHWDEPIWPEDETAIRAVIAEPYRLVSGEDGE